MAESETHHLLDEILDDLSPSVLLERAVWPLEQWREEFTPTFLTTSSYQEMIDEVARFVCFMRERWFSTSLEWPQERGRSEAMRLLNSELGGGESKAGEFAAMKACRYGETGGLRMVLDSVARGLQREALSRHLDIVVLPKIAGLSADESMRLADAYLEEFRDLPNVEVNSPAFMASQWRQTE